MLQRIEDLQPFQVVYAYCRLLGDIW
jgi:hypothetical protein